MNVDLDLTQFPIIPVIVLNEPESAKPLAEALLAGGLKIIEVTFRTEAAAESIRILRNSYPELAVGAGTVVSTEQARMAIDAGSQFGLAPGTDPETITHFQEKGIPFIPGVMTPSDIQTALKHDCSLLKFFPAGAAGGPTLLKAMAAPYKNRGVRFCPTGGISPENMMDYLRLPEVFAIGGSWLATPERIKERQWKTITETVVSALEQARNQPVS